MGIENNNECLVFDILPYIIEHTQYINMVFIMNIIIYCCYYYYYIIAL